MFKRFTIGAKILIGLLGIALLVVGSNYSIFVNERKNISQNFLSDLLLINNSKRQLLENELGSVKKQTADFSSDGYIRDATKEIITGKKPSSTEVLDAYLTNNKLILGPGLLGIDILSNAGIVVASTNQQEIGKDETGDTYFPGTEDLYYGDIYMSDFIVAPHFKQGVASLVMAAPLMDRISGMRIGTLMNFIKVENISALLGRHDELFLGVSKRYNSMHSYIVSKTGLVIDPTNTSPDKGLSTRVNKAVTCAQATGYTNSAGVAVMGVGTCLDSGWMLVTEIDQQEAIAPLINIQRELSALVLFLIIAIVTLLYVLNRQISRPIRALFTAAQKISEGHLDVRTHIQSADEIGDLSKEFDNMTQKLQESHTTLAQKIREVTQNLEKFKLAVEGASDHVIITDTDGKIIYANRAAEVVTGYSQKEMIGNRPSLWGKQMPQEFYQHMWRTIKEEQKSFIGEVTNKRKNDGLYISEIHISPLFDEKGKLYGFVAIERDITKQKQVDRSKTEFVSIASHQLRTPLTIINWYVEMMTAPDGQPLSEKQLRYLDEITRASKRMIELVNSLLNVSRIDMGTFMVEPEPVNFASALDDALKDLSPQIAHKKITVIKNIGKDLPLIDADPKLLRMIFQNLLTNAVKYTLEDGVITASIEQRAADVLIMIADTGMGIPQEQQSKIFQKFFRADNARMKEPDGNGLGLYIIKSIVENAGGKIWFSSEEDKGAAFYVTLPLSGMEKHAGTKSLAL